MVERGRLHRHRRPPVRGYRLGALAELDTPAILKTADFGYDGKGQVRIEATTAVDEAWNRMGRPVGVLEALVPRCAGSMGG